MVQYDIFFDPKVSKWKIRMVYLRYWLWADTKELIGKVVDPATGEQVTAPLEFGQYAYAEKYVKDVGLHKAYEQRYPRKYTVVQRVNHG